MYLYLTISTKYVLILRLSTKAVDRVNNIGNRSMMEPHHVFLSPQVRLCQSGTRSQAWFHAKHTPGTSLASHYRVEIANFKLNSDVNGLDRYLMLNETSINVQNDCQGNSPSSTVQIKCGYVRSSFYNIDTCIYHEYTMYIHVYTCIFMYIHAYIMYIHGLYHEFTFIDIIYT